MAIKFGLAWDLNLRADILESDCTKTIELVKSLSKMHHPLSVILMDVQTLALLHHSWECSVQHHFGETNACANYSAKQGVRQNIPMKNHVKAFYEHV